MTSVIQSLLEKQEHLQFFYIVDLLFYILLFVLQLTCQRAVSVHTQSEDLYILYVLALVYCHRIGQLWVVMLLTAHVA